MKKDFFSRIIALSAFLVFILVAFCACSLDSSNHFLKNEEYRSQVEKAFNQKIARVGAQFYNVLNDSLSNPELEAMHFLYAYMPDGDMIDHSSEYYLNNIRSSFSTRQKMEWGKKIPDLLFRHFVLPIRINNENLDNSRWVIHDMVAPLLDGLTMKEAIQRVNHWCHEKVVYTPSDARTSSPLASIKTAFGRCGEESTFTVAALRSVGIPARQVYTPRWAHTDDNHAWVEAWADGTWYFLGACEPEPVLNLGWFNGPASRGMLMHTRVFGHYNGPEEVMRRTTNFTEINVIDNYAKTAKANIHIVSADGTPAADAMVKFMIYNYAEFHPVATKIADSNGNTFLTSGKGDMIVWAAKNGEFGFKKLSFGQMKDITIKLDAKWGDIYSLDMDITPPPASDNIPPVTAEQRAENNKLLALEDSIRNAYVATFISPAQAEKRAKEWGLDPVKTKAYLIASRGNHEVISNFLKKHANQSERAFNLLDALSNKDLRDVSTEVLNDSFDHADAFLNPRVENEMLTAYKKYFQTVFTKEQRATFKLNPEKLVTEVKNHIVLSNPLDPQRISISPEGVWKSKIADKRSRDICFVAAARSCGIDARRDYVTGKIQYRQSKEKSYVDVFFDTTGDKSLGKGIIQADYKPSTSLVNPTYYSHFTIAQIRNDGFPYLLSYDEGEVDMGQGASWKNLLKKGTKVDAGYYLLLSGTRLSSGKVLAHLQFVKVNSDKTVHTELVMRQENADKKAIGQLSTELSFMPLAISEKGKTAPTDCFIIPNTQSKSQFLADKIEKGNYILAILGVNQEPTNHVLRDIAKMRKQFNKIDKPIIFLFPDMAAARKFRPYEFGQLPEKVVYGLDLNNKITSQIKTSLKLADNIQLPLLVVANSDERIYFVTHGYTIGVGEQIIKVLND